MSINNLEKALINIFTIHGYLKENDLQDIINEIKADFTIGRQQVSIPTLFRDININLRKFSMEIKSIYLTNANNERIIYHSLVNTEEDYVSKEFGSTFNTYELKYFSNIAIKLLENEFLSSDDLIDFRPIDKMSRDHALIFVKTLESQGWLRRNDANYIILGIRTQLELRSYLENVITNSMDDDIEEEDEVHQQRSTTDRVRRLIDEMPQIIVY